MRKKVTVVGAGNVGANCALRIADKELADVVLVDTETRDGVTLPVYRGDAINDLAPTPTARTADPRRMLVAYDKSAQVIGYLAGGPVYTSHEALLLEYEESLVRVDPATGALFGSSAHLLWVGDRSRRVDGPHVDLLARLANPVAVKVGPTATAEDIAALVERLDPARTAGRLILIARLGAERSAGRI